jgi:hypothetical protein
MGWKFQMWCRIAGALSIALWLVSLFLTCYAVRHDEIGTSDWATVAYMRGWELLFFGWFGSLYGEFAWFANPCWLWNTVLMMQGRRPNPYVAAIGLVLAATALHSFHYDAVLDDHGANGPFHPHAGAYVWAASLVPALLVAATSIILGARPAKRPS